MSTQLAGPAPDTRYWIAVSLLGALIAAGLTFYLQQLQTGLGTTGLGRDVSWGLYIAQFAFAEGLAAAAVVALLPLFLHRVAAFEPIALPAVIVAIAAVVMCMLFILADLGQPARVFNVLLHPRPGSLMFWDTVSLSGYLAINIVIALQLLAMRRSGAPAAPWLRPLVLVSLPWGVAVHTVSAFMLGGLAARPLWFTTILAPRFLASAFAAGAALLLLICLALRRLGRLDAGAELPRALGSVLAYALGCCLFFMLAEAFATLYAGVPEQMAAFGFLYDGHTPQMWLSAALLLGAPLALLLPSLRGREPALAVAAVLALVGLGLDKGYSFIIAGFAPTPLGDVPAYAPTLGEWAVVGGIWGVGALFALVCYRVALAPHAGS